MSSNSEVSDVAAGPGRYHLRRRYVVGTIVTAVIALAYLYAQGWSTQPLTLRDGRSYDVLNWDRHVSYSIARDGRATVERYFWVRYYSRYRDPDRMRQEARHLAPALSPFADSLGYVLMKVEPAYPLLFRRFPIAVYSTSIRFRRDTTGLWHEQDR